MDPPTGRWVADRPRRRVEFRSLSPQRCGYGPAHVPFPLLEGNGLTPPPLRVDWLLQLQIVTYFRRSVSWLTSENSPHAKFAEWRLSEEYPMPLFKTECSQSLPLSPISPSPSRYQRPAASLLDPILLHLGFLQEPY